MPKKHSPFCSPADCLLTITFDGSSTFSVWTKESGEIFVPAKTPVGKLKACMENTWSWITISFRTAHLRRNYTGNTVLWHCHDVKLFNSFWKWNKTNTYPYLWTIANTTVGCVGFGLSWICFCELNGLDRYLLQIPQHGSVFMLISQLYSAVMELLSDPFNFPHHSDSLYVITIYFLYVYKAKTYRKWPARVKSDNLFGVTVNFVRVKIKRKTSSV